MDLALRAYVYIRAFAATLVKDEAGEGVISTAIAVLIMAALGAAMWIAFNQLWGTTNSKTSTKVNSIGN
jgi:hypothetical protein